MEDGGYLLAIQKRPARTEGHDQSRGGGGGGGGGGWGGGSRWEVPERRRDGSRDIPMSMHGYAGGLLPAISAVPGDKGLDRYEKSRHVSPPRVCAGWGGGGGGRW